jgi:hypothetical protein
MAGSVVMLVALSGFGCQNKDCGALPVPLTDRWGVPYEGSSSSQSAAPLVYPAYSSGGYRGGDSWDDSGGCLRATLWSFVLGRDPDVPTPREIEASVYSNHRGYVTP